MSVREYIGARYITKFADPIEHDSTRTYEPLIIVQYQGASYVSRMYVPIGIPITDTRYWLLVADYNAQIAQYRNEVEQVAQDIGELEAIIPASDFSENNTVKDYIDSVDDAVSTLQDTIGGDYSPENTIADALTDIRGDISDVTGDVSDISTAVGNMQGDIDNLEGIIPASAFTSSNTVKDAIDTIETALPIPYFNSNGNTVKDNIDSINNDIDSINNDIDIINTTLNNIKFVLIQDVTDIAIDPSLTNWRFENYSDADLAAYGITNIDDYIPIGAMFKYSTTSDFSNMDDWWCSWQDPSNNNPKVIDVFYHYVGNTPLSIYIYNPSASPLYFKYRVLFAKLNLPT